MNTDNIPRQLLYNFVRPKGYASDQQDWTVNPMGGQNRIDPSQILRYQINLNQGFFDPYRSYWQMDVATDIPLGCLQVDNSAFGFIGQSLIINNSAQIQRISQYDQIAAITSALGYPQVFAVGRDYQGYGRSYFTNQHKVTPVATSHQSVGLMQRWDTTTKQMDIIGDVCGSQLNPLFLNGFQSTYGGTLITNTGTYPDPLTGNSDTLQNSKKSRWNSGKQKMGMNQQTNDLKNNYQWQGNTLLPANTLGMSPSLASQLNIQSYVDGNWYKKAQLVCNGLVIPRAQYNLTAASSRYLDKGDTVLRNNMVGKTYIRDFDPVNQNAKYDIQFRDKIKCHYVTNTNPNSTGQWTGNNTLIDQPNICSVQGFQQPYSQQLSVGCDQPFISTTIPQCSMQNGKIMSTPMPVRQKRFIVPFLSAVMGIQIPKQSYALLPLKAFQNTIIQLTLNKYAMFSSGYNDRNPWDINGMLYPIQRAFYFTRFNYVLKLYTFQDPDVKAYMQTSLLRGIVFTTQIVNLCSQYMVANQLSLRGTWTVNTTAGSISHLIIRFLDNRYLQYPFLRKQYALSCNISSLQIKFDTKYFPPQPIVGNAGNPQYLDTTGNVQPYLNYVYQASDWTFNQKPLPIINPLNFSINQRIFDPTRNDPYIGMGGNNGGQKFIDMDYKINPLGPNSDTAMGFPWFHQNRCVGRALYMYNFQPQGHSLGLVNGLNAGRSRPFQLTINTTVKDPNPNQIGMYVFLKSHSIVAITNNGIRTQGFGGQ